MIKSLNSLRFVFAFMIFLHHFSIGGSSVFREGGNLSVSFFFILSGFVLAYSYGDKVFNKQVAYKEFILKRINRLFPLHIFGFIIALLLYSSAVLVGKTLSVKYLLVGGVNALLLQSWIPIKSVYFSYNAVSWCLSDQLFFYLMFPFLIGLMLNKSLKKIFYLLLPLVISYILIMIFLPASYVHQFFYINPLFRITDFIIGIFLFLLYNKKIKHIKLNNQLSTFIEILSVIVIATFVVVFMILPIIKPLGIVFKFKSYAACSYH